MQIKVDIAKLFREKKYSEIISIFDNKIPENQRNSRALIYLGVSRILKGEHSNKNFLLAINDFKKATLKVIFNLRCFICISNMQS